MDKGAQVRYDSAKDGWYIQCQACGTSREYLQSRDALLCLAECHNRSFHEKKEGSHEGR